MQEEGREKFFAADDFFLLRHLRHGRQCASVLRPFISPRLCHPGTAAPDRTHQLFIHILFQVVIRIDKADKISGRRLNSGIPGRGGACIFLPNDMKIRIGFCQLPQNLRRSVRRAVVHRNDFQRLLRIRLV